MSRKVGCIDVSSVVSKSKMKVLSRLLSIAVAVVRSSSDTAQHFMYFEFGR